MQGCVLCLPLNEGSGVTAADISGAENNGIVSGTWVVGKCGTAVSFNGSGNWAVVANNSSLKLADEFTVSAWVKLPDVPIYSPIIIKGAANPKVDNYLLLVSNTDGKIYFYVGDSTGTISKAIGLSYTTNVWQHWVGVFTTTNIKLYLNAVSSNPTTTGWQAYQNNTDVRIGYKWANYFNGIIDDVRIYNYALSAPEVFALYKEGLYCAVDRTKDVEVRMLKKDIEVHTLKRDLTVKTLKRDLEVRIAQ